MKLASEVTETDAQRERWLRVSVIICTRDRESEIIAAVASLVRQRRLPDELIVVDSGEGDRVEAMLQETIAGRFPLVYWRTAPGLPRQRNAGVALATGELVLFLDDDVILDEAYLAEISGFFERQVSLSATRNRRFTPCKGGLPWVLPQPAGLGGAFVSCEDSTVAGS